MKRVVFFVLFIALSVCLVSANMTRLYQDVPDEQYQAQAELIESVQSLSTALQLHPVRNLLMVRRIFVDQVLRSSSAKFGVLEPISSSRGLEHGLLRPPMAWELISMLPPARLYSFYTAADLGGYGENEPPYEPSSPFPADGAAGVPLDDLVLVWIGGDPDPDDTVFYDVYFGTDPDPPLVAENILEEEYAVDNLTPDTVYYWQIIARDNWDAETEGPVWSFETLENFAPYEPVNPVPPDGAVDVDRFTDLEWECNDPNPGDVLTYDVYFGMDSPPPLVETDVPEEMFDPGELQQDTLYYWQIVARDNWGAETNGPVWSFTTMIGDNNPPNTPSNPFPENTATDVDVILTMTWEGGDPDPGDTVTYDLYFGTEPSPQLIAENLPDAQYTPPEALEYGILYYWYIIARDSHSAETSGPLWSFTTVEDFPEPTPTPTPPDEPTPTPTPPDEPCVEYSIALDMGSDYFCPGDTFGLMATLCNPEDTQYLPVWVILDVWGEFWFAPSWSQSIDYYLSPPLPAGWSTMEVIPPFTWPNVEGSFQGAIFWGAISNTRFEILSNVEMLTFGWGPCM
jgi:hypothetical protein